MKWARKKPDVYRWHKRFALFPKRIGDRWIWLEKYAWRRMEKEEHTDPASTKISFRFYSFWEEFALVDGYTAHLETSGSFGHGFSTSDWHKLKPRLKVVGGNHAE